MICPGFVIGPMLSSRADGESVQFMKKMLDGTLSEKAAKGELKGNPRTLTDVRDLALAHVRAMEKEAAIGKRFLVASETPYLQATTIIIILFYYILHNCKKMIKFIKSFTNYKS